MKKFIALILSLILLFSLTACSSSETDEDISVLIAGTTTSILTANRSEYNFDVLSSSLCQLTPVYLDENREYQPLLCDYVTEDSKTWTFTIREGMTWHDGTPVTAYDFEFTLYYLDEQKNSTAYAASYAEINVIDDMTIELVLFESNPRFLSNLTALRIYPEHIYSEIEDYSAVDSGVSNIGCGPYVFVNFDKNAGVLEFEAYEAYPDGSPNIDTIYIKLYSNDDTLYMALQSGEIDMIYKYGSGISSSAVEVFSDDEDITLQALDTVAISSALVFNTNAEPFDDATLRKAVAYAIDYEAFRTLFGSSYSDNTYEGFVAASTFGFTETAVLAQDLERSIELLEEAGYTDTDGDGFVDKDGENLVLPILIRSDRSVDARYAELIKNNLALVGIDVSLELCESAVFTERVESFADHTAIITSLTAYGMEKDMGLGSLYIASTSSTSYAHLDDEVYLALLEKAQSCENLEDYALVAAEIQKYYADNMPAISLLQDAQIVAYSSALDGFVVDSNFGIFNIQSWFSIYTK